jgi:hypothetical protein
MVRPVMGDLRVLFGELSRPQGRVKRVLMTTLAFFDSAARARILTFADALDRRDLLR